MSYTDLISEITFTGLLNLSLKNLRIMLVNAIL